MQYKSVSIDPEILGGTPVFIGTRVPLQTFFDYIEGAETLEEFLDDYPTVSKAKAMEVLEMAKQSITRENL